MEEKREEETLLSLMQTSTWGIESVASKNDDGKKKRNGRRYHKLRRQKVLKRKEKKGGDLLRGGLAVARAMCIPPL